MTVKEHMTIRFEEQWWKYAGAKEAAIREAFSESPVRYYQRLDALIDRPDAEAEYPTTVRRLRRLRDRRLTQRSTAR